MSVENANVQFGHSGTVVDSQLQDSARIVADLDVNGGGVHVIDRQTCCAGFIPVEQTDLFTVDTHIGDVLSIHEHVVSNAVIVGFQNPPSSSGIFDASVSGAHTSYATFTPITPDVGFLSALGCSYTAPVSTVPEPSTLLLLGSGLVGLAAWRRKRAA